MAGRRQRWAVVLLAGVLGALLGLPAPTAALAAGDPYRDQQWALERIGVERAWQTAASRGDDVIIAVVDTGVDLGHPDLRERFLRDPTGEVVGLDLVADGAPQDEHGHGTLVAGVIAATADNGAGIAGVAPEARLMPIRVLDEVGSGEGADVDTAIRWAVDQGADVVNLSLESVKATGDGDTAPGAPTDAVRYAWERGVIVVAAAGNSGGTPTEYPLDSPVLLVGAVDRDDRRAEFSAGVREDAVLAPGVEIVSTWCRAGSAERCDPDTHTYGMAEGTSFAAPHVSGALALLLAAGHSPEEAVARLRASAVDLGPEGPDAEHGHGRIDVAAALATDLAVAHATSPEELASPAAPAPSPVQTTPPVDVPDPTPQPTPSPPAQAEPQAIAVPVEESGRPRGTPGLVHLVAAVCLGITLATWSAVARRQP